MRFAGSGEPSHAVVEVRKRWAARGKTRGHGGGPARVVLKEDG